MFSILDKRTGHHLTRGQFLGSVVDAIETERGRKPCYELLEGLDAVQRGDTPTITAITLGRVWPIPEFLRGATFQLVEADADVERWIQEWREEAFLSVEQASRLLQVDEGTVVSWIESGRLLGAKAPDGLWRVLRESVPGAGPSEPDRLSRDGRAESS